MTKQRALTAGTALALVAGLALTGCGVVNPAPGSGPSTGTSTSPTGASMDATQTRTEYLDLLAQIEAMAPGNWIKQERLVGDTCTLPDGSDGTVFADGSKRDAIPVEQIEPLHQKVKAFFESKGLMVTQSADANSANVRRTVGFGPGKLTIGLTTSDIAAILGGTSRCGVDPEGKYR